VAANSQTAGHPGMFFFYSVLCLVSTESSKTAVKRHQHCLFDYKLVYREIVPQSQEIFRHIKLQAAT